MGMKKAQFIIKGMNRDLSISKFNPQYAYENFNMRIAATDSNDSFSLVNERGNRKLSISWDSQSYNSVNSIVGVPIGQELLNNKLVLFTTTETNEVFISPVPTENLTVSISVPATTLSGTFTVETPESLFSQHQDYIYKFWFFDNDLNGKCLFCGDLNMSPYNPIDSISIYENEQLQKVYWVDGRNQPRIINIEGNSSSWNTDSFNFINRLSLNESVTISKSYTSSGVFAPGTIQYCFTYFNLYGQQTNIFYSSPLYYISYVDRGANPTDTVSNSFSISLSNLDQNFDYVRIYSIHRTSTNATPQVKVVADLAVNNSSVIYNDTGTTGFFIEPMELQYVGGKEVIAGCINHKDNTLFLGNIYTPKSFIDIATKTFLRGLTIAFRKDEVTYGSELDNNGYYNYRSQLSQDSQKITTFKYGETYRFGLQFQDTLGNWSEVCWINDLEVTSAPTQTIENDGTYSLGVIRPYISADLSSMLNLGYVKVRPVVVYPSLSDCSVICQGVLNPTVYNVEDRYRGAPFAQASWFFRPNSPITIADRNYSPSDNYDYDSTNQALMNDANTGKWAEFRHNYPIPSNRKQNAEIQCISYPPSYPFLGWTNVHPIVGDSYTESSSPEVWVAENKECFYVDQSIVTLNSPDIEFNSDVRNLDMSDLHLRIVGAIKLDASTTDIDIQTSTPPLAYSWGEDKRYPDIAPGFYREKIGSPLSQGVYGWKSGLAEVFWLDEFYGSTTNNNNKLNVGFVVYPWHRNGSLNNTRISADSEEISAKLSKKKMSILRYSSSTQYFNKTDWWEPIRGISGATIFDLDEDAFVKIPRPDGANIGEITYKGNVDKAILFHSAAKGYVFDGDSDATFSESNNGTTGSYYPIIAAGVSGGVGIQYYGAGNYSYFPTGNGNETLNFKTGTSHINFTARWTPLKEIYKGNNNTYVVSKFVSDNIKSCSNNPVSMKYKSTPHAVIAFNYDHDDQVILPTNANKNTIIRQDYTNEHVFWDYNHNINVVQNTTVPNANLVFDRGWLWLGELCRSSVTNRFGGTTEEALENNNWVIGGSAVTIAGTGNTAISWTEGDTYYQRYDCLKTYPFTMEDQNSVVDILSFMCETRVNIDGRYDRNRGQMSNLYMSPRNFNLLNPAYTQNNNFFQYRTKNTNKLVLQKYPNTVTWTKTKTYGEEIDTWTNITLASTMDFDGSSGQLNSIKRFNNDLIVFQNTGISQILYNDNVQIAATTGVPIEIANSGKVSGKRYISDRIGCTNKWSICSTPMGIYFADNTNKDLYIFNGSLNNLSDTKGFHSWTVNKLGNTDSWNPVQFNNLVTYYDPINGDVMFINNETCLAYSESLGEFSSFYSYDKVAYFASLEDKGIAWRREGDGSTGEYYPWIHRQGEYNNFFGLSQPFYTTVVVNPDPTEDKIFNNVEFRADSFSGNTYVPRDTFNKLITWNEYQKGVSTLSDTIDKPSTLKKKFRVWRANIPRWNAIKNYGINPNNRDRMRNPWLYLTLKKENPENYKTILHDIVVDYFE